MANEIPKSDHGDGDGPKKPSAEQHHIAVAIESLKEQYETAQGYRADHERQVLRWSRIAGIGVALYTLVTVVIMCASIYSAKQAKLSAEAANRAVEAALAANEIAIRPYIKIDLSPDSFKVAPRADGLEMSMQFSIENIGKLPAPANVGGEILWSGFNHERGPWSFAKLSELFLFPNQNSPTFTVKSPVISEGQIADLKTHGNRSAYVTIQVLYGPDQRHWTDRFVRICTLYPIKWDGNQFSLDVGDTCPDDSSGRSSYAN